MKDKGRRFIHGIVFLSATAGIFLDILLSGNIYDQVNLFSYFTIQTNFLVGVMAFYFMISQTGVCTLFRTGATLWISMTGLAYHFLLSKYHHPKGLHSIANYLLHYATPIVAIVAFFTFISKGRLKWYTPFILLIYPLLYLIGTSIRGRADGYYPYWFVNPEDSKPAGVGSYKDVLKINGKIMLIFLVLGCLLVFIQNKVSGPERKYVN